MRHQDHPKILNSILQSHLTHLIHIVLFNMRVYSKTNKQKQKLHKTEREVFQSCFYYLCLARCENVHEVSHLAFSNKFRENVSTLYAESFNNTITSEPLSA